MISHRSRDWWYEVTWLGSSQLQHTHFLLSPHMVQRDERELSGQQWGRASFKHFLESHLFVLWGARVVFQGTYLGWYVIKLRFLWWPRATEKTSHELETLLL